MMDPLYRRAEEQWESTQLEPEDDKDTEWESIPLNVYEFIMCRENEKGEVKYYTYDGSHSSMCEDIEEEKLHEIPITQAFHSHPSYLADGGCSCDQKDKEPEPDEQQENDDAGRAISGVPDWQEDDWNVF